MFQEEQVQISSWLLLIGIMLLTLGGVGCSKNQVLSNTVREHL